MRAKPKPSGKRRRAQDPKVVTVRVTVRNNPPDAALLAAQRKAMETILAVLTRD